MMQSNTPQDEGVGMAPDGAAKRIRVFYDGSCPLCRSEIRFLGRQEGSQVFEFDDISKRSRGDVAEGLSCELAMKRMHVQKPDGEIVSGARAFLAMWGALPRYRSIARALSVPPIPAVLEAAYRVFLVVRPALQRLARSNERAGKSS